jgi:hypothetical protein
LQAKLRNRNRKKQRPERKETNLKGWEPRVRAWKIPHESEASAMLRNFFLMLIKNASRNNLLEETNIRRVIWQKEIIFKKATEKNLDIYKTRKIVEKNTRKFIEMGNQVRSTNKNKKLF